MTRKVFKYGTGEAIPEGAIYLSTQVETDSEQEIGDYNKILRSTRNTFVWHYFLVEVQDDKAPRN